MVRVVSFREVSSYDQAAKVVCSNAEDWRFGYSEEFNNKEEVYIEEEYVPTIPNLGRSLLCREEGRD